MSAASEPMRDNPFGIAIPVVQEGQDYFCRRKSPKLRKRALPVIYTVAKRSGFLRTINRLIRPQAVDGARICVTLLGRLPSPMEMIMERRPLQAEQLRFPPCR